ncbi:unnamed protein product [Echinostoma caproni]|uniref:G_PROTEIN_RECEP_F1_2 domain-containing protein n=1 Tax=Echinostoma caproni TaxID=27848 RepID=A0A183AA94_9TREM|nr:unnamed protein product [Echinostoma caproni]
MCSWIVTSMCLCVGFALPVSVHSAAIPTDGQFTGNMSAGARGLSNDTAVRKVYAPSAGVIHEWVTGERSAQLDTGKPTTINPIHAQWILLHAGYGRPDFASHRIPWIKNLLVTTYTILAVIGVVSNLTVVYILLIRRRRALANITNVFVLVLAISDVTLCGFNMPMQAYYELKEINELNSAACKIVFTIFGIPMHISCLTILMIACDRYQIIIYPLYPRMSTRFALFLILLICLLSILNSLPIALYSTISQAVIPPQSTIPYTENHTYAASHAHTYCVEMWPNVTGRLIYSIVTFLVHFLIPLCLTMGLYGHIFFRLHESRFRRSSVERKRRTNKILVRIVVCFAVCWTPWCCFCLWVEVLAFLWQSKALTTATDLKTLGRLDHMNDVTTRGDLSGLMYQYSSASTVELRHMDWVNRMVSHKAKSYLDRELFGVNRTVSGATTTPLDASAMATLTGGVPLANPDLFSILDSEGHEEKIRLIDLLLRLFAMGSGCINPWLYGWLNKFVITLSKLYWVKLTRAVRLGTKFREWNARWRRSTRLSHSHGTTLPDHADLGHSMDGMANSYHSKRHNDAAVVQVCYCCGNWCKFNFVFSRSVLFHGRKQDHLSFLSSGAMNGNSQRGSHREGSYRDSQRNVESCERCAATAARSGTGSRTSQSGSGRQKGSKCSAENLPPNAVAQLAEFEACLENAQQDNMPAQNRRDKECHQCSSYKRFGRRYSSRLSASSVGTVSYLDPSTKQTSLLPSSGFTPTPRGSFLRPGDPVSAMRFEATSPIINYGAIQNNKAVGNNLLVPPTMAPVMRGRSIDSGSLDPDMAFISSCGVHIKEEESQVSHTCAESETESENPVITLFCPAKPPQTDNVFPVKTELITLQEQSDSTSFEQGMNQNSGQSNHHEVVQINVHACDHQPGPNNSVPLADSKNGFQPTKAFSNPWSNASLGSGIVENSQHNWPFSASESMEIPFADEDSEEQGHISSCFGVRSDDESEVLVNPYADGKFEDTQSIPSQTPPLLEVKTTSISYVQIQKCDASADCVNAVNSQNLETVTNQPTQRRDIKRRLSFYPGFILRQYSGTEDSVLGGLFTLGFDESSDADDFTHIGRMVALEAIRKQQARNRAMSVGSMLPASHTPKKTRQSLSQVPTEVGAGHRGSRVKEHQTLLSSGQHP